jgi:hypothetical protein
MRYPIPQSQRQLAFLIMLVLTVVVWLYMALRPLRPFTIIDYEFAGSGARALEIVGAWQAAGADGGLHYTHNAVFSLGVDLLWIPCYVVAISLGCMLASGVLKSPLWVRLGAALAGVIVLAGAFDYVENVMLLQTLFDALTVLGSAADNTRVGLITNAPAIAAVCAGLKFAIVGICILYALTGGVMSGVRRVQAT